MRELQTLSQSPSAENPGSRLRRDDLNEVLAWIDYCVAKNSSSKFKATVVDYLSTVRRKDFTWEQIDQRILALWKNDAESFAGTPDHSYGYMAGTKALRTLN